MGAAGGRWTGAGMPSAGLRSAMTGSRPGLAPLVAAAGRGLLVDGFRALAFVIGAVLVAGVIVSVPLIGLSAVDADGAWTGAFRRSPGTAARELSLVSLHALEHVLLAAAIIAYLGVRIPMRQIAASTVPAPAIRRGTALVGGLALAGLCWFALPMQLTPVLAIGVSLLPLVFVVAVLRVPHHPMRVPGRRAFLLLTAAVLVRTVAAAAFVLSAPAVDTDLSAFGEPGAAVGLDLDSERTVTQLITGRGTSLAGWTDIEELPAAERERIASVRTEVRAAEVLDGRLLIGDRLASSAPARLTGRIDDLAWVMPAPTSPRLLAIFTIATLSNGRTVILDPGPTVELSPEWDGPLFRYWLARSERPHLPEQDTPTP